MKQYRIYTEAVPGKQERTVRIVSDRFEAFTVLTGHGCWRGVREASLIFELVTDDEARVHDVATTIKLVNKQESVLVTSQNVDTVLI